MILVDTSALIAYLRGDENVAAAKLARVIDEGLPFGITPFTVQEVLQGARTERDFDRLREYLHTQRIYAPKDGLASYAKAARLYRLCRTRGLTVRGSIDCLIAQVALEHGLFLLHDDRDFEALAQVAELEFL